MKQIAIRIVYLNSLPFYYSFHLSLILIHREQKSINTTFTRLTLNIMTKRPAGLNIKVLTYFLKIRSKMSNSCLQSGSIFNIFEASDDAEFLYPKHVKRAFSFEKVFNTF